MPTTGDLLDMAHRNVTLLQRLVNQLIDFRRYEDGRLALNLSRFDLRTALLRWTDAFRALSFRSHIHLHVQPRRTRTAWWWPTPKSWSVWSTTCFPTPSV